MKRMFFKTTAIAVVFLCSNTITWAQENEKHEKNQEVAESSTAEHNIYLALSDDYDVPMKTPQEVFDCTDKVYSVLELSNFPMGKHQLSVRWFDPSQTVQEHTRYDFNVRGETTRLWAWLSLSRGTGAGMLQWINPAAGLEGFIGIWKIEVKIDGKRIGTDRFEVSC